MDCKEYAQRMTEEEIRQLAMFRSLPRPLQEWWEKKVFLAFTMAGREPDYVEAWFNLSIEDRWKLIGYLVAESVPSQSLKLPVIKPSDMRALKSAVPSTSFDRTDPSSPSSPFPPTSRLFDLTNLIKEDKRSLYPHAAWFCPSGWGKDFNSSKLIGKADGEIIACLIKEPEIWQKHCPQARIICNGYDVSEIEKVLQEVSDRNESRMLNHEPKTPITVILSDYPSIVQGIEDITQKYIARPVRDGRSNLIRFWFLIQEGNVEALDMKGRSDLLRSITMVRGGDFALEHAGSLLKTGILTKEDIQFLNSCDRPCIVGNTPSIIN